MKSILTQQTALTSNYLYPKDETKIDPKTVSAAAKQTYISDWTFPTINNEKFSPEWKTIGNGL